MFVRKGNLSCFFSPLLKVSILSFSTAKNLPPLGGTCKCSNHQYSMSLPWQRCSPTSVGIKHSVCQSHLSDPLVAFFTPHLESNLQPPGYKPSILHNEVPLILYRLYESQLLPLTFKTTPLGTLKKKHCFSLGGGGPSTQ